MGRRRGAVLVFGLVMGWVALAIPADADVAPDDNPSGERAAAPACQGTNCDGLDPVQAGCDVNVSNADSQTVPGVGTVELRWSPECSTNWVRVRDFTGASSSLEICAADRDRHRTICWDAPNPGATGTRGGDMVYSAADTCAEGWIVVDGQSVQERNLWSSACPGR
ncbi:DUF2690 domain-containing protein [Spiractinospora alimapuensis]|uniref:DUF2690 domain-containing protein n=1 Tax=Spiractinospora alimapuensis TaxID=2820884 RepID=UPI001F15FFF2|nr:DUF2690 domain-containing protein [Spiractinospora alimapuensis]QVQ51790.1 DUF2690 domain-containing protein [Spiractinospora alimapuensis]